MGNGALGDGSEGRNGVGCGGVGIWEFHEDGVTS